MDKNIGVGIIVGLTFASTVFILRSDYFTKSQKIVLGILFVFPPAQWVLAITLGFWNKHNSISMGFNVDKTKNQIKNLENFRNEGILTEEEFRLKTNQLIERKQTDFFEKSDEYKSLKQLKNENIFTEQEFLEKVDLLKTKILNELEESSEPEELTKKLTQIREFKIATGRIDKSEFRKKFIYFIIIFIIALLDTFFLDSHFSYLLSGPIAISLFLYSIYLIKPAARRLQDLEINGLWSLLFIYPVFALIFGIYLSLKDGKKTEKSIP